MSARKAFGLADAARADFRNIMRYTVHRWGVNQARRYREKLGNALALIAESPGLGHSADDLPERYRLFSLGSHAIIYVDDSEQITVVRILHQRMNRADHI
jgi:toxin ParE1/3/4